MLMLGANRQKPKAIPLPSCRLWRPCDSTCSRPFRQYLDVRVLAFLVNGDFVSCILQSNACRTSYYGVSDLSTFLRDFGVETAPILLSLAISCNDPCNLGFCVFALILQSVPSVPFVVPACCGVVPVPAFSCLFLLLLCTLHSA